MPSYVICLLLYARAFKFLSRDVGRLQLSFDVQHCVCVCVCVCEREREKEKGNHARL